MDLHEEKLYNIMDDTIQKMSKGMSHQADVYLMSDIKRLAEAGILKIQYNQPDFKMNIEGGAFKATLETRLIHSAEETIKNLKEEIEQISELSIKMTLEEIEPRDKRIRELTTYINIEDDSPILPICYEAGEWDGKRSDFVIVNTDKGEKKIARLYSGFMDGCEFNEFYCQNDYEVGKVISWIKLPE